MENQCQDETISFSGSNALVPDNFIDISNLEIKHEIDCETIMMETNLNHGDVDVDPMDLLELGEEIPIIDDTPESDSNSCSNIQNSKEFWSEICGQFPYILHDLYVDSPKMGYCLYCDMNLVIQRVWSVRKHEYSVQHAERAENYISFFEYKKSIQDNSIVKEESDLESSVAEKIAKRKLEKDALLEYNWTRWMKAHVWLQKDSGVNGFCKFCKLTLVVEFRYQRERHEARESHKRAIENQLQQIGGHRSHTDIDNLSQELINVANNPYYKSIEKEPGYCICTACDTKLIHHSFRKHTRCNSHIHNVSVLEKKTLEKEDRWAPFQKKHPWLIGDPEDNKIPYCKYCAKRMISLHTSYKRKVHENTGTHKVAALQWKKGQLIKKNNNQQDRESEFDRDKKANKNIQQKKEKYSIDDDDEDREGKLKQYERGSPEWCALIPWCKPNPKNPVYVTCKYCDIDLALQTFDQLRHENSVRHIENEIEYKQKHFIETSIKIKKEKSIPVQHWVVYSKSIPKYVFCRYCRVKLKSEASRLNHANSIAHKEAELANLKKLQRHVKKNSDEDGAKSSKNSDDSDSSVEEMMNGNIEDSHDTETNIDLQKLLLEKFNWLSYKTDEERPNYGYCNYCEQGIFLPTMKVAIKHQGSAKHLRISIQKRHENLDKSSINDNHSDSNNENGDDAGDDTNNLRTQRVLTTDRYSLHKMNNSNSDAMHRRKSESDIPMKFAWLIPDKVSKNYGYCKYCETSLMTCGVLKKVHNNSIKHRDNEIRYKEKMRNMENNNTSRGTENYNESILLPQDDDVVSIKSESSNDSIIVRNKSKKRTSKSRRFRYSNDDEDELPMAKCPKLSYNKKNAMELAERLTTAHSEILRLSRSFSTSQPTVQRNSTQHGTNMNTGNTSNQQNMNITPSTMNVTAPAIERNSYDLFFNSVCETVKKFPTDLAAETKVKFMEVLYDFEIRALQRLENNSRRGNVNDTPTTSSTSTTTTSTPARTATPTISSTPIINSTVANTSPPAIIPNGENTLNCSPIRNNNSTTDNNCANVTPPTPNSVNSNSNHSSNEDLSVPSLRIERILSKQPATTSSYILMRTSSTPNRNNAFPIKLKSGITIKKYNSNSENTQVVSIYNGHNIPTISGVPSRKVCIIRSENNTDDVPTTSNHHVLPAPVKPPIQINTIDESVVLGNFN